MTKVAILMPVRNGGEKLIRSVQSVVAQTIPRNQVHLFVVDNGSTDEILIDVDEMLLTYDWTLLECDEPGIVPALNTGLIQILGSGKYDYIARLDADDFWYPEKLTKQLAFMEAHPDIDVVGTQIRRVDLDLNPIPGEFRYPTTDSEIKQWLLRGHNALAHPSVMIRAKFFLRTGGYDNTYPIAEDYHLWLKGIPFSKYANLDEVLIDYTVSHNPKYNPHCPQLACMAMKAALRLHEEK